MYRVLSGETKSRLPRAGSWVKEFLKPVLHQSLALQEMEHGLVERCSNTMKCLSIHHAVAHV